MEELCIRRAAESDIPALNKLLYQVHRIHSDARPDLFKPGAKKYNDGELEQIVGNDARPIFVAEEDGQVLGYVFCIHQQHIDNSNMTDIKTLYIDDLCVDEAARGRRIGRLLYEYVLEYARQRGYYNVTLNVCAANDSALRFYQKLGLQVQKLGMEKIL